MDEAETRFSWLLAQRRYRFWHEGELDRRIKTASTRPDFFAETPYGNLLAEVESFREPGPIEKNPSRIASISPKALHDRLRGAVKHGAKQLRPYQGRSIPCLVVLDNWRQIQIPTDATHLIQIFGELEYRGEVDPESAIVGPFRLFHGKGRRLKEGQHTYISAVAVNIAKERYLDDDMTLERPMRLTIVHNPHTHCHLPTWIFLDRDDEQWRYVNGAWVRVWPAAKQIARWLYPQTHRLMLIGHEMASSTMGLQVQVPCRK